MKKLLVLGGTGRTGKCVIQEALNRGYEVNAIVRDAAKLEVISGKNREFQGKNIIREKSLSFS
jgi:putative NADH-flavin reductase